MGIGKGSGRGGKRPGAGRKPGSRTKSAEEIAQAAQDKAMRDAEKAARRRDGNHRQDPRHDEPTIGTLTILPPIDVQIPPNVEPLDFLKHLMRNDTLSLAFRRDCAALALPFAHAKPLAIGLKDQRNFTAAEDDDDDISRALRG